MLRSLAFATCVTLAPSVAIQAQVVSRVVDDVEVAVYRGPPSQDEEAERFGLAMISEERIIDLPGGPVTIQFQGVADAVIPQTAKLEGLPTAIESNFDYDLLSPGALLAKLVGLPVRVVRTNRDSGAVTEQRAILRSGPQGVMLEIDGRFEAFDCSGMDERLVFDRLPTVLFERPTLSMSVNAPPGRYKVRLSYLTLGVSWAADYVAKINPDGRTLDLTGWVTLTNKLSASFGNAPVKVIAGNLSFFADETLPPERTEYEVNSACWPIGNFYRPVDRYTSVVTYEDLAARAPAMARMKMELESAVVTGSFVAQQSELGDYKLYSLPERTTVAANQTKQVRMLEKKGVRFNRVYVFPFETRGLDDETAAAPIVTLRLENKTNRGLGLPLPAGIVSVMEPAGNRSTALAGEDEIADVPVGLPIDLELGESLDVWVQPRVVSYEGTGPRWSRPSRAEVEVLMGNDKAVPVTLELRSTDLTDGDVRFKSESKSHTMKYGNPQWTFTLASGARASLRYKIEFLD